MFARLPYEQSKLRIGVELGDGVMYGDVRWQGPGMTQL
jgi:hypothetical protein